MEEYLKREKRRRIKRYCIGVIISILIAIIIALIYLLYYKTDINYQSNLSKQSTNTIQLSQTVAEINQESKTITQVIEEVNQSVVGISKLKN